MKMIVSLLKVGMLGQAGLAMQLAQTIQRECPQGQDTVCTFYTEVDYLGDSYSLCSVEVERSLGVPFNVETVFDGEGDF